LAEGPLHAALKRLYAEPGDEVEAARCGCVVDVARAWGEVVEIQTKGFGRLRPKLERLLPEHPVLVVHPVAAERRVVRVDERGEVVSARRSPKRDTALAVFDELVFLPEALEHEGFAVEIALTREDVVHGPPDGRRRRRRPSGRRHLVDLLDRVRFDSPADLAALLPAGLEEPFTVRELAAALPATVLRAQRAAYVLRALGLIEPAGKRARAPLYTTPGRRRRPRTAKLAPASRRAMSIPTIP
jgi:hypothetical protein